MKQALLTALDALGLAPGDSIMVHSDAMVVAQFPGQGNAEGIAAFWSGWRTWLGHQGTLIVPTFTYSLTRGECFDPMASPSQVGLMTDIFRTLPGVVRTHDPLFSVALAGAGSDSVLAACPSDNSFGPRSVFAWLEEQDGWLVGMGCHPDRITFTHYVEQQGGVSYRYMKRFVGERREAGHVVACHCDYFVRDLSLASEIDLTRLVAALRTANVWRESLLGRIPVWAVRCRDFSAQALALLAQNPYALIRQGALT